MIIRGTRVERVLSLLGGKVVVSHGQDDLESLQEDLIDRYLDGGAANGGGSHNVLAKLPLLLLRISQHCLHFVAQGNAARDN